MPKFRDLALADRRAVEVACAVCARPFYGPGYFCSDRCDNAERDSRIADRLVRGLRAAAGIDA